MLIKVAVLDLDGTIVRRDGKISDFTIEVLREAQASGIRLFLATGRTPDWIENQVELARLVDAATCCYGSVVWQSNHQSRTQLTAFSNSSYLSIFNDLLPQTQGTHLAAYNGEEWLVTADFTKYGKSVSGVKTICGVEVIKHFEASVLYVSTSQVEVFLGHLDQFCPDVSVNVAKSGILELRPSSVNKGVGISFLFDQLGIEKEGTAAFGNDIHDLPLFELCQYSIAVSDAHHALKESATLIVPAVGDDGVARMLRSMLACDGYFLGLS